MHGGEVWEWFLCLYGVSLVFAAFFVTLIQERATAYMNEELPFNTASNRNYMAVLCWLLVFVPFLNTAFMYYGLKVNIGKTMGWDKKK